LQPFLGGDDSVGSNPDAKEKEAAIIRGTDRAYELGTTHGVKMARGTDALFHPTVAERQGAQLAKTAYLPGGIDDGHVGQFGPVGTLG
jgi:hypothetical protein